MAGAPQQVAGAGGFDDAQRQAHGGGDEPLAQLGEDPLAQDPGQVLPTAGQQGVGGGQGDDDGDEPVQPPGGPGAAAPDDVDHLPQHPRDGHSGGGRRELGQGDARDGGAVLGQEGADAAADGGGVGHGQADGAHAAPPSRTAPPRPTTAA